jgi:hypothetical protein
LPRAARILFFGLALCVLALSRAQLDRRFSSNFPTITQLIKTPQIFQDEIK